MKTGSATVYLTADGRKLGSHARVLAPGEKQAPALTLSIRIVPPEAEADCIAALAIGRDWGRERDR